MASHVRSGHCPGAGEDEVQKFKQEFVYETPKNLVHKSALSKRLKESFEIEEYQVVKSPKMYQRTSPRQPSSKKTKLEKGADEDELIGDESEAFIYEEISPNEDQDEKVEYLLQIDGEEEFDEKATSLEAKNQPSPALTREEKFIREVYPQFKGKTKLQLIEDILDLKRRNETLQVRAKTYENTINRLLN